MAIPTSLADLKNPAKFDIIEVTVQHEEEEPLNIELENVQPGSGIIMVKKILTSSLFEGSVHPGDYILSINNHHEFKSRDQLFFFALKQDPQIRLTLARPKFLQLPAKGDPKATPTTSATAAAPQVPSAAPSTVSTAQPTQTPLTPKSFPTDPIVSPEVRLVAVFQGATIKPAHEYYVVQLKASPTKKLGLGIRPAPHDKSIIFVSSVEPNSSSSEAFKPGDRFLTINLTKIDDKQACIKILMESGGNFDAFIERPASGLLEYGIVPQAAVTLPPIEAAPLKSSYTQPNLSDPEERLGNPLMNYEAAPDDVQAILNRVMPILIPRMAKVYEKSTRKSQRTTTDKIKIEHDVTRQDISSDVGPDQQLRKIPKK